MRIKKLAACGFLAAVLLSSCSTPRDITYFQDVNTGTVIDPAQQMNIRVRPDDKLSIVVSTQDPALSTLFNLVSSQSQLGRTNTDALSGASSGNAQTSSYTVSENGDIKFPFLGKLHIAGMKRTEVAEYIEKRLVEADLVKDPTVTVEFLNTGISVIGEVASPGRYGFNKDRLTLIDALAMAGDLTVNGRRDNVIILRRNDNGTQDTYRVDLTDMRSLASSPVYYLQQDDVIYVEPNDKKKRETTPNGNTPYTPAFWVSMGSFAVTIATMIITLSR